MKKLSLYVFLVLMFSLFTSHSFAAKKHKIYKKLPCRFNGAIIKTPANPDITKKPRGGRCCRNCKGYLGKQGTEIKKKKDTQLLQFRIWNYCLLTIIVQNIVVQ